MIQSRLYNFLIDPKYRIWRHILFILAFASISYRQTTYLFQNNITTAYTLIISLITLSVYLLTLYANIYFLVPRYLLNKKYGLYLLGFFLIVFVQIAYMMGMEYTVRTAFELQHRILSYNLLVFMQHIPSSIYNMMCILGTSVIMLIKHQVLENERMNRMEQENIKSELDRLKEQISPAFLSNILNKTSVLVKSDPIKASDMLMKLGQLLRYQLYDSSRDRVLLSAEINFLTEYLELGQLYCDRIEYKLVVEDHIKELFMSPLLFISFIQQSVNQINNISEKVSLQIHFETKGPDLIFTCQSNYSEMVSANELFAIKKRLGIIYADNYSLTVKEGNAVLQLNNISGI